MLSKEETRDIDKYLGRLIEQLPSELDASKSQTLKEEATRLRTWTERELSASQDANNDPPVRRQILYCMIAGVFCLVMAGVFYYELIPQGQRNPAIIIPTLILFAAGQMMGRCQQLRRQ